MIVDVRRAVIADAPAITAVLLAGRRQSMPWLREPQNGGNTVGWIERVLLPTTDVWVAVEEGGQVIGFVALGMGVLEQLYIAPRQQKRGIGARLLAQAKDAAGDRLSLYTFARNAGARRFYERHGFTIAEEIGGSSTEEREPNMRYEWRRAGLPTRKTWL